MGDSKNISSEEHNERRRAVKAKQNAVARASSAHDPRIPYHQSEDRDPLYDVEGVFSRKTEEHLASLLHESDNGILTTGMVFSLMNRDEGHIVVTLKGPEEVLAPLNLVGAEIQVRPHAFRLLRKTEKTDEDGNRYVEVRDCRTPVKIRTIMIRLTKSFGLRFKYSRGRIVTC